jgi:hypothetical protein
MSTAASKQDIEKTWIAFCDELEARLKKAGQEAIDTGPSTLDRHEGLRLVLRGLRYSLERDIEERDTDFPVFTHVLRETMKGIADSPDYTIQTALISGTKRYRIRGVLGTARKITISAHRPFSNPVSSGSDTVSSGSDESSMTGSLDETQLAVADDGSFEIIVANQRPGKGVWLRTTPDTQQIHVRNIFPSQYREVRRHRPAKLMIERLDGPAIPLPYSAQQLTDGLQKIIESVGQPLKRRDWLMRGRRRPNGEWEADQVAWQHGNHTTYFQDAFWEIAANEAMIIEMDALPTASFWSLIFTNFWMESLDYRYHSMYLNNSSAVLQPDGSLRVIVAHRDPGLPNWIDTAGHSRGAMVWRWNDVDQTPSLPRSRVVPFEALPSLRTEHRSL